jgi:PEP-CTERM motif
MFTMFATRPLAIAAVAAFALAAPLAAQANLIVNGSFETEAQAGASWTVLAGLTGWQADAGSGVELRNAVAGAAHQGANFIELDTHTGTFGNNNFDNSTNSGLRQTVSTQAGASYELTWFYSPREGVAADSNDIKVYWNGNLLTTNGGSGEGKSGNEWTSFSFTVTGTGSDTLRFAAGGKADSLGGSLDSVSLVAAPVPEPGSLALLVAGLAAVAFVARRRQG